MSGDDERHGKVDYITVLVQIYNRYLYSLFKMENQRARKSSSSSQSSSSSSSSSDQETFQEASDTMETIQKEQKQGKGEASWEKSLDQAWRNSIGEVDEKALNREAVTNNASIQFTASQVSQESLAKGEKITCVQQVSQESLPTGEPVTSYVRQVSQESASESVTSDVQQSQEIRVVSGISLRSMRIRASSSSSSQDTADLSEQMKQNSRPQKSTSEYSSQGSDVESLSSTPMSPTSPKSPEVQYIIRESSLSSGSSVVGRDLPLSGDEPTLNEVKFELSSWPSRTQSVRTVKVKAHKPVIRTVSNDSSVQSIYTGLMERHIKELKGKGS